MRILFITNFYPPSLRDWGYMQLCEMVANGLQARGHQVAVLTSTDGATTRTMNGAGHVNLITDGNGKHYDYPVHRLLPIDPDWTSNKSAAQQFFGGRRQREAQSVTILGHLVTTFQPDLIFIWHGDGLARVMLQAAEQRFGIPAVYYLANYLPELPDEYIPYWQHRPDNFAARVTKSALAPLALAQLRQEGKPIKLAYPHVICVSDYLRGRLVEQSLIPESAVVIPIAVDITAFSCQQELVFKQGQAPVCVLVAGRIVPDKGVHTVIQALGYLNRQGELCNHPIQLTILGDGPADYRAYLETLVHAEQLENTVIFRPRIPNDQMPAELQRHHIQVLPSEYQEPLAGAMLEGMAMGRLMIGTTTGGSGELLLHKKTGLVFEAGNSVALAEQLLYALNFPEQAAQLAKAGKEAVLDRFTIDETVTEIESYLAGLMGKDKQ